MTITIEIGKPRRDGAVRAYIRVSHHGVRKRVATGIFLYPKEFSLTSTKGLVIKNIDKMAQLEKLRLKFETEMADSTVVYDSEVSSHQLNNAIEGKQMKNDFFKFWQDWLDSCTLDGKKNYQTAFNSFRKFVERPTLPFAEITPFLLQRYSNSLADRPRAQSQYLAAIRHIWNQADKLYEDDMPKSPFRVFTPVKQKPVGKRAVNLKVIKKIWDYEGTGRAMLARDCYLLSFFLIGMNSADLYSCKSLKRNTIAYDRRKTYKRRVDNAHTEIKIPDIIKPLVEKYKGTGTYVFNFHSRYADFQGFNRAINIGLKTILGKKSKVTFYSARHTWATIARNELGIEKSTVNDGLIHIDPGMDVTDLYIQKDYKNINKANARVVEYVREQLHI